MSENIEITEKEKYILICLLCEQIDVFNVRILSLKLEKYFSAKKTIVLDLSNVQFSDSSGLGGIINLQKKLQKTGSELIVTNLTPRVENIMLLTQTNKFITCCATNEEAYSHILS